MSVSYAVVLLLWNINVLGSFACMYASNNAIEMCTYSGVENTNGFVLHSSPKPSDNGSPCFCDLNVNIVNNDFVFMNFDGISYKECGTTLRVGNIYFGCETATISGLFSGSTHIYFEQTSMSYTLEWCLKFSFQSGGHNSTFSITCSEANTTVPVHSETPGQIWSSMDSSTQISSTLDTSVLRPSTPVIETDTVYSQLSAYSSSQLFLFASTIAMPYSNTFIHSSIMPLSPTPSLSSPPALISSSSSSSILSSSASMSSLSSSPSTSQPSSLTHVLSSSPSSPSPSSPSSLSSSSSAAASSTLSSSTTTTSSSSSSSSLSSSSSSLLSSSLSSLSSSLLSSASLSPLPSTSPSSSLSPPIFLMSPILLPSPTPLLTSTCTDIQTPSVDITTSGLVTESSSGQTLSTYLYLPSSMKTLLSSSITHSIPPSLDITTAALAFDINKSNASIVLYMVATGLVLLSVGIIILVIFAFRRQRKPRPPSIFHIEVSSRHHWEQSCGDSLQSFPGPDTDNGFEDISISDRRQSENDLEYCFQNNGSDISRSDGSSNTGAIMDVQDGECLSELDLDLSYGYASAKSCVRNPQKDAPPEYTSARNSTCSRKPENSNRAEKRDFYVYATVNKVKLDKETTINNGKKESGSESSRNSKSSSCVKPNLSYEQSANSSSTVSDEFVTDTYQVSDSDSPFSAAADASLMFDQDNSVKHDIFLVTNDESNSDTCSASEEQMEHYGKNDFTRYSAQSEDLHITVTADGEMFVRIQDPAEKKTICDVPFFYI